MITKHIVALATGTAVLFGGIFVLANFKNHVVPTGKAGYITTKPIFDKKEFKGILIGPNSTTWVWRQECIEVSITPYTIKETFIDIRAKDQLKMKADASLVCKIDSNKIQEFVERYGAASYYPGEEDKVFEEAYNSFIQQPFRTAIRTAIATYNGLEATLNIPAITESVSAELTKHFEGSPFLIDSITIGSIIPPESVTEGITRKVEATQLEEKQRVDLRIAKQAEEIAISNGRAIANKMEQEAQGKLLKDKADAEAQRYRVEQEAIANLAKRQREADGLLAMNKAEAQGLLALKTAEAEGMLLEAKGREALEKATGENIIKLKFVENMKDIKLPSTLVGGDIIQSLMNIIKQKAF